MIVCTRNRPDSLFRALGDVREQASCGTEILVVEQSDPPQHAESVAAVSSLGDERIRLIRSERVGLPHARNLGVSASKADVLLFLDDDVRLAPGCLAAHDRRYGDRAVGGVVGRIHEARVRPNSRTTVNRVGIGGRVITNLDGADAVRVDTLKGANMSLRRIALEDAGPFDECYLGTAFLEDADLSTRVARAGWELWYEPLAGVEHLSEPVGGVRQRDDVERERWRFHNTAYFVRRHRGRRSWATLRATFLAIAMRRAAEWRRPFTIAVLMGALEEGWRRGSTSPA